MTNPSRMAALAWFAFYRPGGALVALPATVSLRSIPVSTTPQLGSDAVQPPTGFVPKLRRTARPQGLAEGTLLGLEAQPAGS